MVVAVHMVTYVLLHNTGEGVTDELKSVTTMNGEQCATMDGTPMML